MLNLISILLLLFAFFFGYTKPRSAIWFVAFTYPLLYPVNFPIIPSDSLYLNITRLSLVIILGVHLRKGKYFQISKILKSSFIKAYLLFAIYLFVVSIGDMTQYYIFSFMPEVYISIALGYFLIEKEKDYKKLIGVLTWQALVFGIIIFLEFFGIVNIFLLISQNVPNFDMNNINEDFSRAGIKRVYGMDGNAINSAVRLVILVPIAFLHTKLNKTKRSYVFIIIIFFSIIILMSRAAYISLLLSTFFIIFQMAKLKKNFLTKILYAFKIFFSISTILILLFTFSPFFNNIFISLYSFSFESSTIDNLSQRTSMIPFVLELFINNFFIGQFKSPLYIYKEIMGGHDLALPLIYVISGGFTLLILFFNWWIRMPFYFIRKDIFKNKTNEFKLLLILVSASFVGGIIPMLSNWVDTSVSLMLIIFCSTFKYNIIKKQSFISNNSK
ncbi:hypothetical protein OAO25_01045 [Flavobacteriaceae bacterium]|nr:hypothetical protein [Flavobacteriaceae bacterium]